MAEVLSVFMLSFQSNSDKKTKMIKKTPARNFGGVESSETDT
jgi:hypothetical protein